MDLLLTFTTHLAFAIVIFLTINWIGKHAVEFGYSSTSLFEDGEESIALNIFVKSTLPTIFIILVSATAVASGFENYRLNINRVVYFYFIIRLISIFIFDRLHLVSWTKFTIHAIIGILVAEIAYKFLILPNKSLLPDLETVGNELWLAIFAFLYAIMNKVPLPDGPSTRRKNRFIKAKYESFQRLYGDFIDSKSPEPLMTLIIYSILVAEDYARPKLIRSLERAAPSDGFRTTGVMQVRAERNLSDRESVERGVNALVSVWQDSENAQLDKWDKFAKTVASHNRDDDYVYRVSDIARIIAKRVNRSLETAYDEMC